MSPPFSTLAPYALGVLLSVPGTWFATRAMSATEGGFELEPGQAALVIAAPDAAPRAVDRAGRHRARAPFERATVVDARPARLAFGAEDDPDGTAPLRVRSLNGSVFTLDGLEIQWRVAVERLAVALEDGAAEGDPAQRDRVRLLATAALRDAFGALDSEAVADAFRAREALDTARAELAALLERHGLELLTVIAPQPRFDREYEHAIEQRKLLEQEVERLEAERAAFPESLATMLEKTRANQRLTAEIQEAELAKLVGQARAELATMVPSAELEAAERRAAGEAERLRLSAEAASRRAIGAAAAASLAAEVDAFEAHGDAAVREALIERLSAIRFEVAPPAREARP